MVVSGRRGALVLIRQVDHAELAGAIARYWGNDRFIRPSPYESVCLGASRHDDGWVEPDARPLYDPRTRRPLHFPDVDHREHSRFYRGGIERVIAIDPYAGLLVSMHATGLYRRRWGVQPDLGFPRFTEDVQTVLEAFIVEQEAVQARIKLRILDPARRRSEFERDLWHQYEVLQVWDRLSLFACMTDLSQSSERHFSPAPPSPGGPGAMTARACGDGLITLDPYPFDESRLDLSVPCRVIPDRDYAGEDDVRAALANAHEDRLEFSVAPAC